MESLVSQDKQRWYGGIYRAKFCSTVLQRPCSKPVGLSSLLPYRLEILPVAASSPVLGKHNHSVFVVTLRPQWRKSLNDTLEQLLKDLGWGRSRTAVSEQHL